MINKNTEDGISPMFSVMLLVALTVIFAAVVAAFVFSTADSGFGKPKMVVAVAQKPLSDKVIVTYYGGPDANLCTGIAWNISNMRTSDYNEFVMGSVNPTAPQLPVGTSKYGTAYASNTHVVGTAYFIDGTQQVILDKTL